VECEDEEVESSAEKTRKGEKVFGKAQKYWKFWRKIDGEKNRATKNENSKK
jgi:hypothetical protein